MAELFLKHKCGYCQEEIVGVRIRCTFCADYDLCLECFSLGAEAGPHKPTHGFKIIDPGTFHLFAESEASAQNSESTQWTAADEYQLLDAIEQFGYGNWEDVAKYIEAEDSEITKEHFCQRYVLGAIGRATWPNPHGTQLPTGESRLTAVDHTCPDNGPLSPTITSRLPPLVIQHEESVELGYMPQRDDFEKEHDNEAELVVSHLSINHDDDDVDLALKLAQVDMYVRRLRERTRRKRVVRDYQLVSQFFSGAKKAKDEKVTSMAKKREAGKEKEIQEKFKVFSQFHTACEHEQFLRNLARERALKTRVRELAKYRRNGLTRHEECTEYERARYFRDKRKEAQQERQAKSGSSGPGTALNPGTLPFDVKREPPATNSREPRSILRQSSNDVSDCDSWPKSAGLCDSAPPHLNLSLLPGYELLTSNERQICQSLQLRPLHYVSFKTSLLLNAAAEKPLTVDGLTNEEQRVLKHYLCQSGLLSVV